MMSQQQTFAYARDGDVQVIELTYGGDLSMVVVLPDGTGDPPAVERNVADHPFLYLIRDRQTGAVLFLGRVAGLGG